MKRGATVTSKLYVWMNLLYYMSTQMVSKFDHRDLTSIWETKVTVLSVINFHFSYKNPIDLGEEGFIIHT